MKKIIIIFFLVAASLISTAQISEAVDTSSNDSLVYDNIKYIEEKLVKQDEENQALKKDNETLEKGNETIEGFFQFKCKN